MYHDDEIKKIYEKKISEFLGMYECIEDERVLVIRLSVARQIGELISIHADETDARLRLEIADLFGWWGYYIWLPGDSRKDEILWKMKNCLKSIAKLLTAWHGTAKAIWSR